MPHCRIDAFHCDWLNVKESDITSIIKMQKIIINKIKKRMRIIHKNTVTHRDLLTLISNY